MENTPITRLGDDLENVQVQQLVDITRPASEPEPALSSEPGYSQSMESRSSRRRRDPLSYEDIEKILENSERPDSLSPMSPPKSKKHSTLRKKHKWTRDYY